MKTTRRIVQLAFLLLTLIGVFTLRGNAERWCPFGGVEAIYGYINEGNMLCSLGVSNFYILAAVIVITILLRRAFCGYMCPIGTVSEWLRSGAKRVGVPGIPIPGRLDWVLRWLKYPVLAVILYFTYKTSELIFRGFDPCYALLSRHGEDITVWSYTVSGSIVVLSLLVVMPFCRWFCPLAAVMHLFSKFGFTRIKRDGEACVDCGLCAKSCPMAIPVDKVEQVTEARCISCMNCVQVCPTKKKGALVWGPPRMFGRSWSQGALIAIMLFPLTAAVVAVYAFPMPSFVKIRGEAPAEVAQVELRIHNLTCRGKATSLWYFLERDDFTAVPGYLRVEAWPGPGVAQARVLYDPSMADEQLIKDAIVEPYFDADANFWRPSPFVIEGYDPLGLGSP